MFNRLVVVLHCAAVAVYLRTRRLPKFSAELTTFELENVVLYFFTVSNKFGRFGFMTYSMN